MNAANAANAGFGAVLDDAHLLVFARCAGFVFRAPGFSHPDVPPPVRAGFAYALTLALAPRAVAHAVPEPAGFVASLAAEAALGAAIGTAASMLYDGAYAGGRALDDYVGIRASVPSANVAAGAGFGRLWSLAFSAAFFTLGGCGVAIGAFADTFAAVPPGALVRASDLAAFGITLPATLLRAAFFVAGPPVAIALLAQVALAGVARVVPRFSTFALAFPIVFACVVLATVATLPYVLSSAAVPWMDLVRLKAR